MTLIEALVQIKQAIPTHNVVMIEQEDGSGMKFNYRLEGEKKNRFVDFTKWKNEFVEQFHAAAKIMEKW